VVLVLGVAYALVCAGLYVTQERALFPAPEVSPAALRALADRAGAEEITLRAADGVGLYALRVPAVGDPVGVVVYAHGNATVAGARSDLYRFLSERGWEVLAPEYRGYPGSDGAPSESGIARDMQAAWRWAVERFPAERIVLHGMSLGGGAVGTLLDDVAPGGLVLEATFTSVTALAERRAPGVPVSWLLRHPFDTVGRASRWRAANADVPVLVLHGDDDALIPVAHASLLGQALPGASVVIVPDRGHQHLVVPEAGGAALAAYAGLLDRVADAAEEIGSTP
jgi:fermentation-respiration switch protein FrsA (DUF1100 family)